MNKNILVGIISGISGLTLGGIAGFFIGKKRTWNDAMDLANEMIDDMEKYYKEQLEDLSSSMNYIENEEVNPVTINEPELMPQPLTDEQRADIKRKLKENYEQTTDYSKMYNKENEKEEPKDINDGLIEEREKMKHLKPRIISENALGDLPPYYEHDILYYYTLDDVVTTEDNELIVDPERLLGDCLIKYGFIDNDEKLIFVQNYALDTVYEIQKVFKSYNNIE